MVAQKWAVGGQLCSSYSCYNTIEVEYLEISLVSFPSLIREVTRTHKYTHILGQKGHILVISKCICEYQIECLEADEMELVYYVY